jgi:hypothetical protein
VEDPTLNEKLIDMLAQGGIAGVDIFAVAYTFSQCKFYLTTTPKPDDYRFLPHKHRDTKMGEDHARWRHLGRILLLVVMPTVVAISLLLVAVVSLYASRAQP